METLFIGKRYYTNRDALDERYGRIFQIPYSWSRSGRATRLWLVDYHGRSYRREFHDELEVVSTPAPSWRFAHRLSIELARGVRRAGRRRIVVASGDCYIGLLGYVVARLSGALFLFDVYDKYDEFAGYRRVPGFDPQTFLLRHADLVSFASRALEDKLRHEVRCSVVVPNGVDRHRFRSLDKSASRRELGLSPDATFVGYFGTLDAERGISDLLDAVRLLRDQGLRVELLVGGRFVPGQRVDLDRPWVRYLGNLPFEKVAVALACCDVLAVPYRSSPYLDMASSCKIAEYIAAGRPIAATRTPNFVENFAAQAEELSDLLAAPEDAASLAEAITRQLLEQRLASMPENMDWRTISMSLAERVAGAP